MATTKKDQSHKPLVVIGLLGTTLDGGGGVQRWERWRPTVDLCRHDDLVIDRLELLHQEKFNKLGDTVTADIARCSPETQVRRHMVEFANPWDFQEVYGTLLDFARAYRFDPDKEDYLVHITTGTHVSQICLFLLTEARWLPARLLQTAPPGGHRPSTPGTHAIIDLDLSQYDRIASRFMQQTTESVSFLKSGIDTKSAAFNALIGRIERVAGASKAPILLIGPTGAGKSQLARRIYELKKTRRQVLGAFVEVNCATLRGDAAMSTLFGHVKGAFTGAVSARPGLLRAADKGMLFLDEIGELGADEQAMLLRAVEEKRFLPVGADGEAASDFQLLAGTNCDLQRAVIDGRFREDLFARINLWTFNLPGLKDRREDLEPNIEYELAQFARNHGTKVTFNKEARAKFLAFAQSPEALWRRNFRDLNASISRMATLAVAAGGARIGLEDVNAEIAALAASWQDISGAPQGELPEAVAAKAGELDVFDRVQLAEVVRVCQAASTISDAGRTLFAASRKTKKAPNDADRLRKYLARFSLTFDDLR